MALYDVWRVWLCALYALYALYSVTDEPGRGHEACPLYTYRIQPIQRIPIQESIQPHPTSTWLLGTDGRGIRSVAHELVAGLWL